MAVRLENMKSTVRATPDFSVLVTTHHAMVWRYLRLLGCESAQAEDLTQEVFLTVIRNPDLSINEYAMAAWLRRVARNKFVDHVRRHNRLVELDVEQAEQVWLAANGDDDGEAWLDSLRECLAGIEDRPRTVLLLRYQDKAPVRKVAEVVGMKESGVKTMLGRLKRRLRECVERKVANL